MKAVIDTSAVVQLWRNGSRALHPVKRAIVPLAVHAELLFGLEAAADNGHERRRLDGTYAAMAAEVVVPNEETARRWAKLKDRLRRRGRILPHNDLWIAAAALQLDLPLVSLDRHHHDLPGVAVLPGRG